MLVHQNKRQQGESSLRDVIPLYYRVYETIRKQIERGDYPPESLMPGEHELANRFQVSRVTIRRTMGMLEEANMITRLRGRGTFVNSDVITRSAPTNYSGFDQNVKAFEANTHVNPIGSEQVNLPAWGLDTIGKPGVELPVLRIEYTRSANDTPFSHISAYVPLDIAKLLNTKTLGNKTVTTAIEEAGTIIVRIDQKLTAISSNAYEAFCLHLPLGQPLIRVRRVMYDAEQTPVQFVESVYNPEYFEYHVSLSRNTQLEEAPKWVPVGR